MFKIGDLVTPISKTVPVQNVEFDECIEYMKEYKADCFKVVTLYPSIHTHGAECECELSKADGTKITGRLNFMFRDLIPYGYEETIMQYALRIGGK